MHSYPKLDIIFSLLFDFSRRFLLVKELLPGPVTILLQRKKKCDLSVRKFDTFCSAFLVTTLNQVTMILFTRVGELESWSSVTGVQHIKESCVQFKNKNPRGLNRCSFAMNALSRRESEFLILILWGSVVNTSEPAWFFSIGNWHALVPICNSGCFKAIRACNCVDVGEWEWSTEYSGSARIFELMERGPSSKRSSNKII
jgi:hypothetical protein